MGDASRACLQDGGFVHVMRKNGRAVVRTMPRVAEHRDGFQRGQRTARGRFVRFRLAGQYEKQGQTGGQAYAV